MWFSHLGFLIFFISEQTGFTGNKAVKLVAGGKYLGDVTLFYSQFNVLKLSDLVKHETAKIDYLRLYSHLPPMLSPLFIKSSQISTQITSAVNSSCSLTLHIPIYFTNRLQRSIMYEGVKIWNDVPLAIKSSPKKQFNLQYKNFLFCCY